MRNKDDIDFNYICDGILQKTEIHCYYKISETHVTFNLYNYVTDTEIQEITYTWNDILNIDENTIITEILLELKH